MRLLGGASGAPDAVVCRYGDSRLAFRGPARSLCRPHLAALGGAATFGKGVARPWPQLLEAALGRRVVNFGAIGAGPDAFLGDPGALAACAGAEARILELPGAEALANPFYRVHPRRNDRVIAVTRALRALYPELDFAEFAFVRHLLGALHRRDTARFRPVAAALQTAWADRMGRLLARLPGPVVLLWLGDRLPPAEARFAPGAAPLLVSRPMLAALAPAAAGLVEVAVPARASRPGLPGPDAHEAAARALLPELRRLLPAAAPARRAAV